MQPTAPSSAWGVGGCYTLRLHHKDQKWKERAFWVFKAAGPLSLGHPPSSSSQELPLWRSAWAVPPSPTPPPPPAPLPPPPTSACSFLEESASWTSARPDSEQGCGLEPAGPAEVIDGAVGPPSWSPDSTWAHCPLPPAPSSHRTDHVSPSAQLSS